MLVLGKFCRSCWVATECNTAFAACFLLFSDSVCSGLFQIVKRIYCWSLVAYPVQVAFGFCVISKRCFQLGRFCPLIKVVHCSEECFRKLTAGKWCGEVCAFKSGFLFVFVDWTISVWCPLEIVVNANSLTPVDKRASLGVFFISGPSSVVQRALVQSRLGLTRELIKSAAAWQCRLG